MCVKDTTTVVKHVGKLLARIETSSICRQQFANVFADCFCAVHTHQLEFANSSLPLKAALVVRTRTAEKCTQMQNARAGRAESLFLFIKAIHNRPFYSCS